MFIGCRSYNTGLLTWLTLLQTKAEYNAGYSSLEHSSTTLHRSVGDPFARQALSTRTSARAQQGEDGDPTDADEDNRSVAEVAFDTLNQPGLDFFLRSQAFTSRIISLDRYHRQRGTLETEIETFRDAQLISSALNELWDTRPSTLAFLNEPDGLFAALQPDLANRLLLNLRVYVSNYWALYIYLHRVAFKTFPATKNCRAAVSRILECVRDATARSDITSSRELRAFDASCSLLQGTHTWSFGAISSGSTVHQGAGLPASMLWPMFLAALESSVEDRAWLLQIMREMDLRQVPNASRTVLLLGEVLRRQDMAGGARVDHRSVRQDLFGGELGVFY